MDYPFNQPIMNDSPPRCRVSFKMQFCILIGGAFGP
jgi:hypothetical protein